MVEHEDLKKWEAEQEDLVFNTLHTQTITITGIKGVELSIAGSELRPSQSIRTIEERYELAWRHTFSPYNHNQPYILIGINSKNGKINITSNVFNVFEVAKDFGGEGDIECAGFQLTEEYIEKEKIEYGYYKALKIPHLVSKIKKNLEKCAATSTCGISGLRWLHK